jgi:TP901 family phage tail tape measure protein
MAEDANARIRVDIDTAAALANIKNLQRQISAFHTSMAKGGAAAAASSINLQQGLLNSINKTGQFSATIKNVKTTTDSFTNSLEKNKLSMGEYFRYSGAATKTFGKLFRTEFDTINKVARERVKDLQTQYIKMGRDANGAMQAIAVRPLSLDMKNLGTQTQIAAQRQALLNQMLKQGSTNLLNFGKNTQWAGRQLMVGFTIPLVMFGSVASKTFMDLEKQAIRFKRVYGEMFTTTAETTKALEEVKSLANEFTKYGVAVAKTMEIAADIAAMGRMGADLNAQVAETTRLAILGGVEQSEALKATISLTDAFGVSAEQLAGKIDFLNAVENQTVTSIEDLTIAIPKAGPVVQQLGGDVEDLTFFLTAMREGGINASEGANALKSGLASLINPAEKSAKFLANLGININGIVEANKGNVKGIVIDFANALDTLDPLNRARAIEQLFGKFQFSRLSTLFQNVTREGNQASRVLKLANATTEELAILSERELKRVEDSPMFKFQKAVEDIKVTLVPLGEAFLKAVTPVLEFGTKILEKFNELDAGAKQFVVGLTAIAGVIGPVFLMGFGLIANGVANVIKGFVFFKTAMNRAGSASSQLGMQTEYMTQQQLEASAVAASLDQIHTKLTQTFTSEASAINNLTASYNRSIAAQALMTGGAIKRTRPTKKYASGVLSVPGPKGAGDVIPAMLSPGEAIIPAKQASKYSGFISSMISDNIPGFVNGRNPFAQLGSMVRAPGVKHGIMEGLLRLLTGNRKGMYNSDQNYYKDSVAKNFMRSNPKVAVRMQDEDLIKLINSKDKRYKSLFETQTSRAMDTPDKRAFAENKLFGFGENLDPRQRPVYGYLFNQERNLRNTSKQRSFSLFEALSGKERTLFNRSSVKERFNATTGSLMNPKTFTYGNTAMVLKKKNIRDRTSFTYGDSYNAANEKFATPAKLGSRSTQAYNASKTSLDKDFFEAQILGGFTLKDVKKIIVTQPELIPQLQSLLRAQGIKIPVGMPRFTMLQRLRKIISRGKLGAETLPTIQPEGAYSNIPFGKKVPGYKDGIFSVPGPKGAGDIMPSMLSPGEAVIPAKPAKKYASLIQSMISDNIPGFENSNVKKKSGMVVKDVKLKSSAGTTAAPPKARPAAPKIAPPDTVTGYTEFVTAGLGRGRNSELNNRIASPKALAADFRSAGSMGMSPVVDAMLGAMGFKDQRQIKKAIQGNPELAKNLKGFATGLSSGIANELDKVPDALMGDPKLSSIAKKVGTATAKNFGPDIEKAFKTVQKDLTVALDNTRERINSKNKARAVERIPLKAEQSGYIGKSMKRFKNTGNLLGLTGNIPSDAVAAHLSEPKKVSLSELEKTSTLSKKALEAKARKLSGTKQVHREGQPQIKTIVPAGYTAKQSIAELEKVQGVQKENVKAEEKVVKQKAKVVKEEAKTTKAKAATVKVEKETQVRAKRADAARKGWETRRAKTIANQTINPDAPESGKRKMSGGAIGMVATGAVMAGSMMPGAIGEISQQLMMPVMLLSMMQQMLKPPLFHAAIAITAVVAGAIALKGAFDKAQDESMKLTEAMSGGAKSIKAFSEFSGKVSAGEIMDRRRESSLSQFAVQTGKTTFGESFVQSEAGKGMVSSAKQSISVLGKQATEGQLVNQLVTAVASGALDAMQARSIAANIAQEIGDYSFGINVNAKLIELLGPNGENLLNNPLEVRVKLVEDTRKSVVGQQPNLTAQADRAALASNISGTAIVGGAAIGGAVGGVPGAVVGGIIGAGVTAYNLLESLKGLGAASGAAVASGQMALQVQQEMVDSLDVQYEKRIAAAKAAGDTEKADELTNQHLEDRKVLLAENAKSTKAIVDMYKNENFMGQGAMGQAVDKAIEDFYANDPQQKALAIGARDQIVSASGLKQEQEFQMKLLLSTGDLNPQQVLGLLNTFGKDNEQLTSVLNVITKFGTGEGNRAIQLMDLFVGKDNKPDAAAQKTFMMNLESKDPTGAKKYLDMFAEASKLGGANIVPVDVVMDFYNNDPTKSLEFQNILDKINAVDGKISMDFVQNLIGDAEFEKFKENQAYFESLPPQQQKDFLSAYTNTMTMSGDKTMQDAWRSWVDTLPKEEKGRAFQDFAFNTAVRVVGDGTDTSAAVTETVKTPSSSGGRKSDPLDGILKSLQNIRKASINAQGGMTELLKLFEKGKNISVFKGIENQLLKLTSNTDFSSFIAGLDKKEQDLFITVKNGNVALKQRGRLLEKAYQANAVGQFVLSQQKLVISSKNELAVRNLLIKSGYSYAEAVDMARDSEIQLAFAQANAIKKTKARRKALKELEEALKSGLAAQKATLTAEEEFEDLYDKIQGKLDADKTAIELKFKLDSAADDKIIRDAENKIAEIQYKLDDQEAGLTLISDKEEVINEKYDKRLEALDKIKSVNDRISQQQKNQLSLADALSSGDIGAAASAMQQIQQQFVSDSSAQQEDLIEKARQQELLKVTTLINGELKTREQIEKTIKDLQKEIFDIEEGRLEPALENNRILIAARDEALLKLDQESDKWLAVKNSIEIAKYAALDYGKALAAANALALQAIAQIKNPAPPSTPAPVVPQDVAPKNDVKAQLDGTPAPTPAPIPDPTPKTTISKPTKAELAKEAQAAITAKNQITAKKVTASVGGAAMNDPLGIKKIVPPSIMQSVNDWGKGVQNSVTNWVKSIIPKAQPKPAPKPATKPATKPVSSGVNTSTLAGILAASNKPAPTPTKLSGPALRAAMKAGGGMVPRFANGGNVGYYPMGGLIPYKANGGLFQSVNTDSVAAMLTPGEFVIKRSAVENFGADNLKSINNGTYDQGSVYNYSVSVNVKTDADASQIAKTVMTQIKQIDSQRIRGVGLR